MSTAPTARVAVAAGIGVLLGHTSVEGLGRALVVLAVGLIALHAAWARRPAPKPG